MGVAAYAKKKKIKEQTQRAEQKGRERASRGRKGGKVCECGGEGGESETMDECVMVVMLVVSGGASALLCFLRARLL